MAIVLPIITPAPMDETELYSFWNFATCVSVDLTVAVFSIILLFDRKLPVKIDSPLSSDFFAFFSIIPIEFIWR